MAKLCVALLAVLASGAAAKTRRMMDLGDLTSTVAFGNQWIMDNGIKTRDFRCYLAQDADEAWEAEGTLKASVMAAKRADFQAGMKKVLADYLQCNDTYISFPDAKLPARSWLRVPSTRARDVRSYIDVHIDYPADTMYNAFPKQITSSSAWLLGSGNYIDFVAKWGIGVTDCDPLDADYCFTRPFLTQNSCDRTKADCVSKFPLCTRCVEVFPIPKPPTTVANLTLHGTIPSLLPSANPTSDLRLNIMISFTTQMNKYLGMLHDQNEPADLWALISDITVEVIAISDPFRPANHPHDDTLITIRFVATYKDGARRALLASDLPPQAQKVVSKLQTVTDNSKGLIFAADPASVLAGAILDGYYEESSEESSV